MTADMTADINILKNPAATGYLEMQGILGCFLKESS